MTTTTYRHALRIWLQERVPPPWWPYRTEPSRFAALVERAEAAGWRFTRQTRLEDELRRLLSEDA